MISMKNILHIITVNRSVRQGDPSSRFFRALASFWLAIFLIFSLPAISQDQAAIPASAGHPWVLVIHGGAGGPPPGSMPPEKEKAYKEQLSRALQAGAAILRNGGSSLDAVETAIRFMEDSPYFNAGKGAVLTKEGVAEMDASIMDGKTLMAGAVAAVRTIKNPITAARMVMTHSPHVLLIDGGAEKFAKEQGLEIVSPSYFITQDRLEQWKKSKQSEERQKQDQKKPGTVGAVALDQSGNLAAGTSTGGMMNKMEGRVGDSPIIGAGTYANNGTCAVSCTGHGEFFIRNVVAYDISAMMEYRGMSLKEAADYEINEKLKSQGAEGGLIALDHEGHIAMPFNTHAMSRGYITSGGEMVVEVY
jgi:beta-aspartyl-peptidase (threonine type)